MLLKPLSLITLLLAATEGQLSRDTTSHGPLSNSGESSITWTGRVEEGGELVSITGTDLQHIEAQIREIKPDFSWAGPRTLEVEPWESPAQGANDDDDDEDHILCDMTWDPSFASVFHIRQGVAYLRKIHGDCTNGPGPGNCSRVSCSYRSGIWFCNDNPHSISVPCSAFGDRAWDIVEKCYAHGVARLVFASHYRNGILPVIHFWRDLLMHASLQIFLPILSTDRLLMQLVGTSSLPVRIAEDGGWRLTVAVVMTAEIYPIPLNITR
ncbi:hypothetical protein F5X97DRAFT_319507 [Nemania serpens]|nr:hypothetical protein F5X97DRAFT_319507 [Nemania serpens]